MHYDWAGITSLAYLTLLELDLHEFPIPVKKIKCKDVLIRSYQKYALKTGLSIEEVTCGYELDDAFLLKGLRPDLTLILYNEEKYDSRTKHTLWHEVGHIKCNHQRHDDRAEIEAHFFAGQANAPNVIIREIAKRGYSIDIPFLIDCFGLSEESAMKKLDYFKRYHFDHTNENDDIVLVQFSNFINFKYPPKTQHFYDQYYDDLEKEREKWEL